MTYKVEFTHTARAEAFEAYRYIAERSPINAARWYEALQAAIQGLDILPKRCALAPECDAFGEEIRQLHLESYRILFVIRKQTVFVLHVRHGARQTMTPDEIDAG